MERFIFKLHLDSTFFSELESVHDYGKTIINDYVQKYGLQENWELDMKYQGDLIMGVTMQSAIWYMRNRESVSKSFMLEKYEETVKRLL